MEKDYQDLLSVLDAVREALDRLTRLAGEKKKAAHQDDLMALNEVIKQEQAEALNLRGLENHREKILAQLGIKAAALSKLMENCPESLRPQADACVRKLQESYSQYRTAADSARALMEKEIREIDGIISAMGKTPLNGPGYQAEETSMPAKMKTDFRA